MESYTMTGLADKRAVRGACSGVPALSARVRGGIALGQLPVAQATAVAPWTVPTPGFVDQHNWTRVTVPDRRCRPAT